MKIHRIILINHLRWNKHQKRIEHRLGDYTLIGIRKRWFCFGEYDWILCFFGIELSICFKKKLTDKP